MVVTLAHRESAHPNQRTRTNNKKKRFHRCVYCCDGATVYPPIICGVPPAHVLSPNEDDAKEELLPNNDVPSIVPLPKALDDVLPRQRPCADSGWLLLQQLRRPLQSWARGAWRRVHPSRNGGPRRCSCCRRRRRCCCRRRRCRRCGCCGEGSCRWRPPVEHPPTSSVSAAR